MSDKVLSEGELAGIPAKVEAAWAILSELCKGTHRWTMCVPVQQTDSDIVLSEPLRDVPRLLSTIRHLQGENERLRGQVEELEGLVHEYKHAEWERGEY